MASWWAFGSLEQLPEANSTKLDPHELAEALRYVDGARREAMSPAESLIATLHPWVAFGIMPVFALANAGVSLSGTPLDRSSVSVVVGVTVGLVMGKPLGVLLVSWLTLRFRIGLLPVGLGTRHLIVLGLVAGVGFTMALFIAQLAFGDAQLLDAAKLGILIASGVAAILALIVGRILLGAEVAPNAARTADEAEASTEV